jgi:FkbM family methyltransferase
MNRAVQRALLWAFRVAQRSGALSTDLGRSVYERSYLLYKRLLEAGEIDRLKSCVAPGTTVIDVGANIGFFTVKFAGWVAGAGRVIAIEPEARNFQSLLRRIAAAGLEDVVHPIQAAAAEAAGELKLAVNPHNPADHRLADHGTSVRATTIDDVIGGQGWPAVSLVKIDVQGSENRVLAGAAETLRRYHPAIFMEVDADSLASSGTSAEDLIESLRAKGYRIYRLKSAAPSAPMSTAEAAAEARSSGYADFLFLWSAAG